MTRITLTTDFGLRDTFVGQMKGRILSICPEAQIVDLTHEVPPQDVWTGSFLLATGCDAFPAGTIHVAVVDPGVGTARRPLIVSTERYRFLAPDNGLLTRVLARHPPSGAHVIEASHYMAKQVSATFHGRDVFAPAAAWLARGVEASNFGSPAGELVRLDLPHAALRPGASVRVRIVAVDRFGNATVDLPRAIVEPFVAQGAAGIELVAPGGSVSSFCGTYEEGRGRGAVLLFNSSEHLEVAVYGGSAASELGLAPGVEVELRVGR